MANPLAKLWTGKCTIQEHQNVTDPITHQTTQSLVTVVTDEPCRLSFTNEPLTTVASGIAEISQFTTLFIRPDITINSGSVITVTQNDVTNKYKRSSKPAVYSNHQEVQLSLYEEFA